MAKLCLYKMISVVVDCPYKHLYEGGPVTERLNSKGSVLQLLGTENVVTSNVAVRYRKCQI